MNTESYSICIEISKNYENTLTLDYLCPTNLDSNNIGVDGHFASNVAIIGFEVQLVRFISKTITVTINNTFCKQ